MKTKELVDVLQELAAAQSVILKGHGDIIRDLETRIQVCEQANKTLQAQINGLRERYECLDIQNQTLAKIVEKRFNKVAEAATSQLNLVTKNLEPRG